MKETITSEQITLENLRSRLNKLKEDLGLDESIDIRLIKKEGLKLKL